MKGGATKGQTVAKKETNNHVAQSCPGLERTRTSFNTSSAFIEAYLVRKPENVPKIASEPSAGGEWSTGLQDERSVKMLKKGNTFFPAIFKSPTATASVTSNKQSFTS